MTLPEKLPEGITRESYRMRDGRLRRVRYSWVIKFSGCYLCDAKYHGDVSAVDWVCDPRKAKRYPSKEEATEVRKRICFASSRKVVRIVTYVTYLREPAPAKRYVVKDGCEYWTGRTELHQGPWWTLNPNEAKTFPKWCDADEMRHWLAALRKACCEDAHVVELP